MFCCRGYDGLFLTANNVLQCLHYFATYQESKRYAKELRVKKDKEWKRWEENRIYICFSKESDFETPVEDLHDELVTQQTFRILKEKIWDKTTYVSVEHYSKQARYV